jgi:hypothetical protein
MTHRVAGAPLDFAALRNELEVPGTRGRHPAGADRVGEVFDAVVIDASQNAGTVVLTSPPCVVAAPGRSASERGFGCGS